MRVDVGGGVRRRRRERTLAPVGLARVDAPIVTS